MKPIKFKESNCVIAENQDEYLDLPALKQPDDPKGTTITVWKGTFKDRLTFLCTGRVYLAILTFNNSIQPLRMSLRKWELLNKAFWKKR